MLEEQSFKGASAYRPSGSDVAKVRCTHAETHVNPAIYITFIMA
jgi:hypothetical protein